MGNEGSYGRAGSEITMKTPPHNLPHFVLIGCGGAGITIIDRIGKVQISPVTTVAADTDNQALTSTQADIHILLGNNQIKRWEEGDPAESPQASIKEHSEIEHLFEPGGIVFVVAGLGSGAGSGAASQIAKIARGKGALVIAIALFPFRIQRKTVKDAEEGLRELLGYTDTVIVLDNDRYRNIFPNLSPEKVYLKVNRIAEDVLCRLIESISLPYLINIDPDDFPSVFRNRGLAIILEAECGNEETNKNEHVIRNCLNSPSFDIDYRSATGCLVLITAGQEFRRYDAEEIVRSLTFELNPTADVVWCSNMKKTMGEKVRVYGIMTGIQQNSYREINQDFKDHGKTGGSHEGPS